MEMQRQVIDFIRDELVDDPETEILADTSLFRDQVLDSLNLLALIGHLEKSYAIKIAPSEVSMDNLDTVANIIKFVENKRGQ